MYHKKCSETTLSDARRAEEDLTTDFALAFHKEDESNESGGSLDCEVVFSALRLIH